MMQLEGATMQEWEGTAGFEMVDVRRMMLDEVGNEKVIMAKTACQPRPS